MVATLTILYPAEDEATFDIDHYMTKFVPEVVKIYQPYGLKHWRVTKFDRVIDDKHPPPFAYMTTLVFDSVEGINKAIEKEAQNIISKIPDHSSHHPIMSITHDVGDARV